MVDLHDLRPPTGASGKRTRVGRGPGSGKGKTSGRGHKGQKARSGGSIAPGFEGGQMPLHRRLPKRGFTNMFRKEHQTVNVGDLERVPDEKITPAVLHEFRLADLGENQPIKLLGDGEIERALTVHVHAVSKGAREKIEAAGGSVELVEF